MRPVLAVTHRAANRQPAKAAVPPPALAARMETVTRAGQVTVPVPRSIVNRSLRNRPPQKPTIKPNRPPCYGDNPNITTNAPRQTTKTVTTTTPKRSHQPHQRHTKNTNDPSKH